MQHGFSGGAAVIVESRRAAQSGWSVFQVCRRQEEVLTPASAWGTSCTFMQSADISWQDQALGDDCLLAVVPIPDAMARLERRPLIDRGFGLSWRSSIVWMVESAVRGSALIGQTFW